MPTSAPGNSASPTRRRASGFTLLELMVVVAIVAIASAGGALIHAGLLVLLAAVVIALTQLGLQAWLSAAIVALLTMAAGYLMLKRGMTALRRTQFAPRNTIESLKENARWTTGQRA